MVTSRGGRVWTPAEDAAIRDNYPSHGLHWDRWRDVLPGRTLKAIQSRAHNIGVRISPETTAENRRRARLRVLESTWTDGNVADLATHYPWRGSEWEGWRELLPGKDAAEIAEKANNLGLRRRWQSRSLTNDERRAILTSVMSLAIALRVPPRDVAYEVVRLGHEYERGMA